jgi:histidinol-phosphate/aromatic aminotransferase/cobyric acid decarboxylase-like protein
VIPAPGDHGGDGPAVARALGLDPASVVDLSQSLNPFAPDVAALLARHTDAVRHYPDPRPATAVAAEALGVEADRLLLTNGGSEAIALVAGLLGGTVATEPEFSLHPRRADAAGPVWRSNPRNPTGELARGDERAGVWDEAFYPLATGRWTRGDRDAVVVGSFTKVFSCPGLRLGYVLAPDADLAARLAARQPEWSVNALALAVLPELLAQADLERWQRALVARRGELVRLLGTRGLAASAADAPWVLVQRAGLRERLAPHGVVVRDCTSFGLPEHVRMAVPDDRGLARLEEVLACVAP